MSKTIIVVGAGFFGISTANRLAKASKNYKVKLVSLSSYTYFLVSSIRVPVYNKPDGTIVPLKDIVHESVEIVNDEVVDFNEKDITLKEGGVLNFDALIIATGAKWPGPIGSTHEFGNDYKKYFQDRHDEIERAKHIVLVGGGFNNIELGGELFDKYEEQLKTGEKVITLIHSSDKLLPGDGSYSDTLREQVTNFFRHKSHFNLILNTKATYNQLDDGSYEVNLGPEKETLKADVLYHNIGVIPSVPGNSIKGLTNEKGFIKVHDTFQIEALRHSNIFAVGDVIDFPFKGLAFRVAWMDVLCFNVDKILNSGNAVSVSGLKTAKRPSGAPIALISVGRRNGFGQFVVPYFRSVIIFPSFLVILLKSKYLGVPFAKGILGNS